MQANVKHGSAGELLSRLTWPLDCQARASAPPAQGFLAVPTISWGALPLYPKSKGDQNLQQLFPRHLSPLDAWDGLLHTCLCSTQLPRGSCW